MLWIAMSVAIVVLGCLIAFLFGPTIKTFFGPDFEPSPKDPASVDNAVMNRMPDAGQGRLAGGTRSLRGHPDDRCVAALDLEHLVDLNTSDQRESQERRIRLPG